MDCYTDLLIRIRAAPDPGRPYPVEAVVAGSAQHQGGTLSIDRDALLAQVLDPDAYGRTLSQALLSPPIQRAYERARSRAEARCGGGLRLRLMIDPDAGELQPLRWERLLLSRRHQTVAAGIAMGMPFSRYTALDEEPPSALDTRPVLMLIAVANPADSERWGLPAIDVAAEVASLWEGLSALPDPGALALSVLPGRSGLPDGQVHQLESAGVRILPGPTGAESLGDHMRRFHVVHLIAHGTYRQDSGGGQGSTGLLLESADGTAERVADDRLASRWAAAEPLPRLVYLAACESAAPADSGAATFAGLGPRLVQSGVPAVVAMQDKVPMALSSALTRRFFQSLLTHGQVDRALAEARWLVAESRSADWSIPVLYTRLPEGLLLAPDPLRQALAAMAEWSRDELASRAPPLPVEVARAPIGADSAALARLAGGAEAGYDLEEAIRELLIAEPEARRPFAVLSGGEGSGKSVQLMALVGRLAEEALKGPGTATWLPLLLDLSDWRNREPLGGVEDRLMRALKRFWPELDQQRWRALCSAPAGPRLLFMLDNAQALEESERSALYKGLEELARRAPRQRFLLVCDTWGSGPGCAGELGVGELLVVKRLRFRRVEVYLRGLKDPHGEGPDESAALLAQVLRERRLFDLAGLPWLLFHMLARARQGRPPHTRNAVLEDYVASALAVLPWAGGVRGRARESLRALALELMQRRCSSLPLERALDLLASVRGSREYRLQDMQDALVEARMLIRVGEDCIRFSYPGLQSFSCADALSAAPDWRERIDDVTATLGRLSRLRWWSDTLVLFAGMAQDIDLLIGSILAGGGAGAGQEERVFLAARCIEENDAARLDPMLRGQTVAGLLHLSNADYEPRIPVRIRAVRALQRLQDASAIPQLVRLALEPNRTNWMGKRTVEYSGVRLAAIAALRTLGVPALDQVRAAVPAAAAPIESWIAGDVQALAAALYGGEDQVRPIAAFLLGMLSRSEADDILIRAFAQPDREPLLAWAIADALTLVNPARVTREAIAPSIDPELGTPLSVPKEAAKARRDRLRQLAYLIGKTKPLEPWAGRFLDWCIGESRDAALKGYTIRAFGDLLEGTRLPLLESIARGDFADIAADPGWTQRDRLWLRNEALETLALLGDRETALRLRRDRIAEGPWPPELELALFRTGEEIAARTWEDEGPAARPRGP